MLLQTIIEVVPKFIEECNRLTAARRSGRFSTSMGLCAHCTCLSTMPHWELSTNDGKGTMTTYNNSWNLNAMVNGDFMSEERRTKLFWNLRPKLKTVSEVALGVFSTGPVNKAVHSFRNSLTGVREGWRKTFGVFFSTPQSVYTLVFAAKVAMT